MKTGRPAWIRAARCPVAGADAVKGAKRQIIHPLPLRNADLTGDHYRDNKNELTPECEELMIKIEKGRAMTDGRGAKPKYPWHEMEVGDSFYAEIEPDTLRAAARKFSKRHSMQFKVRKEGTGARAWRI